MKKLIKNYTNYWIYDTGEVYNETTKQFLKGSIGEHGYRYYRLSKDNKKKMFYAHRLVAEAFLDNPQELPVVNHIDGNKLNNSIYNLRLITKSENVFAALYDTKTNKTAKVVIQYDLQDNYIATFPSAAAAARQLGLDSSTITKVCRGQNKTHGGFKFKYFNY